MARIETDPNYTSPTFSRATAPTDLFKKEDVQNLAAAFSTHIHDGDGQGLTVDLGVLTQQVGVGLITAPAGVATSASSLSTIPFLDAGVTTYGGNVLVWATFSYYLSAPATVTFGMSVDTGGDLAVYQAFVNPTSGQRDIVNFCRILGALDAGAHTVHMRWSVSAGTLTLNQSTAQVIVAEFTH